MKEVYNLTIHSKVFKPHDIIVYEHEDCFKFVKMVKIILNSHKEVFFISKKLQIIQFNEHFCAFEVEYSNERFIMFLKDVYIFNTFPIIFKCNKKFVTLL